MRNLVLVAVVVVSSFFLVKEAEATGGVLFVQPSSVVVQNHVFVPRSTQFFSQQNSHVQQRVVVQNVHPQQVFKQQKVVVQNVRPQRQINIRSGLFGLRNTTINVR